MQWPLRRAGIYLRGDDPAQPDNQLLAMKSTATQVSRAGNPNQIIHVALLATGSVLALFLWQGYQGLNLWDEGFLWYGVQRVIEGEVPLRDFSSYDPGRYYWAAALMAPSGANGIVALRVAVAIFQAIGLFIGLALLARASTKRDVGLLLIAAVTFAVWMFPRHKLFDISISIGLIGALSYLIEQPSSRRYFLAGLAVGIAAVFGRNHGLYGAVSGLGVLAYLTLKRDRGPGLGRAVAIWALGVVVGYAPMLLMIALVPGFGQAVWESIRFLFELGATNLPLPVPWPWTVRFASLLPVEATRAVLIGIFFIAIVAYGVTGIAWVIRQRLQNKPVSPALAASAFMALPYAHFAYSRADLSHLAQGIFPLLIGGFALLANRSARIKWPLASALGAASLLVMLPLHPGWQCYASGQCVDADVSGSKLTMDPGTAYDLALLRRLTEQFAPDHRSFVTAPFWPGAYAMMGRKSPMWDSYPILPRSEALQRAEIDRIRAADPGFALVIDAPLDGRDELRFRYTHPLIDQYIREHFEALKGYTPNPVYQIYRSTRPE
jgi:hypothetical protein